MSVHVSSWVWKHSKATGVELLVLLSLADMAHDDGQCWPSVRQIAARCRLSERSVQDNLRAARQSCELAVLDQQGPHGTNLFQFTHFADTNNPSPSGESFNSPEICTGAPDAPPQKNVKKGVQITGRKSAPKTLLETSKEKQQQQRARAKAKGRRKPAPLSSEVVAVFSLDSVEETELGHLAREFGLDGCGTQKVREAIRQHGLGYVQEKAEIARTRPGPAGALLVAVANDWKRPRPKAVAVRKRQPLPPLEPGRVLTAAELEDSRARFALAKAAILNGKLVTV